MKEKYDKIGINYNYTRKADAFLAKKLFDYINPEKGKKYLDIGCGTGNYTIELSKKGVDFIGVDPSAEMLRKAKTKSNKIDWILAKAEQIPLKNEAVRGILATLTIHHWINLTKAFIELRRILQPAGGKIVIFTSTPEQMKNYWLNFYFPEMLKASSAQMPSLETVKTAMNKSGFEIIKTEKYFVRKDLQDFFLYSGKHNPHIYLDSRIRQGISSFSDLANTAEVEKGLAQLKIDIETERIRQVIEDYRNDRGGDYLFIIGRKT
jgi:ubiquinone/menaquinone biosynthesis C-methylase UbiE